MGRVATALIGAVVAALCLIASASPAYAAAPASRATNYLVLAAQGADLAPVQELIGDAEGRVLQSWPEIGVVVAESADAGFAVRLRAASDVVAVGATRNLAAKTTPELPEAPEKPELGAGTRGGVDAQEADFAKQWNLRVIQADAAHRITDGSRDVTVGVLDSGIDATHPDLEPNLDADQSVGCTSNGVPDTDLAAWQPTSSGHGTHVAGIIAAARNGEGIIGVAPNVKLAAVKVVDDQGYIYPEYALCGIVWAAQQGMAVTNNSYLIDPWNRWCSDDPDQAAVATALRRALDYSEAEGVVTVAAAGNARQDLGRPTVDRSSPTNGRQEPRWLGRECRQLLAGAPGVVTVSAVGRSLQKAYYSSYGAGIITVAAPGGDGWLDWRAERPDREATIWSTLPDGRYGWLQGTSMATPHVAGVVALLRSTHPEADPAEVRALVQEQARPLRCPTVYDYNDDGRVDASCEGDQGEGFYGAGLVNALAAVL